MHSSHCTSPDSRRETNLSGKDVKRLLDAADPPLRDLIFVLTKTGCRPHIARELEAKDIDWTAGTATRKSKRRSCTLYLPVDVLARLEELARQYPAGPLLRTSRGVPWSRDNACTAFRKLLGPGRH